MQSRHKGIAAIFNLETATSNRKNLKSIQTFPNAHGLRKSIQRLVSLKDAETFSEAVRVAKGIEYNDEYVDGKAPLVKKRGTCCTTTSRFCANSSYDTTRASKSGSEVGQN